MPVGLGPRFLIEAGFLVAVAVIAGIARLSTLTIVLVMAAAWLLVAVAEWFAARSRRAHSAGGPALPHNAPSEPVRAALPEPQPAPAPEVTPQQIPEPTPEPDVEPEEEPEPAPTTEPEPSEPAPTQPRVQLVPPAAPEPEPVAPIVRQPEAEPEPQVVSITSRIGPREWNLWDLERVARETAGTDVARDEERTYLLMYLRDFANADGILPADFDSVVREAFGDLLGAAYSS